MHRGRVRPIRRMDYDAELRCHALRTIAYMAECSCEWRGPWAPTLAAARSELRAHRASAKP